MEKRIDLKVLLLVHYALHDQPPEYMRDILQERTEGFGDHAFSIAVPTLWNALPGLLQSVNLLAPEINVLRHIYFL